MLSAMLYGLRISLIVGLASGASSRWLRHAGRAHCRIPLRRGWIDALLMRIVDLQLSLPTILVALILLVILGRGMDKIIVGAGGRAMGLFCAHRPRRGTGRKRARLRGSRARGLRSASLRILFFHILPIASRRFWSSQPFRWRRRYRWRRRSAFLGLGLPPTRPSLGLLIANGFDYLQSGRWWISVLPGVCASVLVVSINVVGDRLREVLNPHLRG